MTDPSSGESKRAIKRQSPPAATRPPRRGRTRPPGGRDEGGGGGAVRRGGGDMAAGRVSPQPPKHLLAARGSPPDLWLLTRPFCLLVPLTLRKADSLIYPTLPGHYRRLLSGRPRYSIMRGAVQAECVTERRYWRGFSHGSEVNIGARGDKRVSLCVIWLEGSIKRLV